MYLRVINVSAKPAEDDYDAFRALSRTIPNLHVSVRIGSGSSAQSQAVKGKGDVQVCAVRFGWSIRLHLLPAKVASTRKTADSSSQPIAGPSSSTLDAVHAEEGSANASRPQKKSKLANAAAGPSSIPDASSAADAPAPAAPLKKRKKKHKTREMSSGSVADLSSNVPETPADDAVHPPLKPSGPFVVDSTEPSRAVSPEPTAADQTAEKAKKKKKAEAENANARRALPVSSEAAAAEQPSKKKRRAEETADDTDQPLAKKVKKKSKDAQVEQTPAVAPTLDASTSTRPAEQAEATTKAKKKSKSKKGPDAADGEQSPDLINSTLR